ncbi:Endonuclease, Uma2 family (restriction endonuclease fold) [Streptosporangium subroseum]|uniref:Endonuclease, Uma2 family (Restriction endonuclease fold) n=1 Tax=Streptosporangium subroseum TaxID=106412 RepID=A0A239A8M5_9ACTN|nr:Uma2 family endonuclease [Streptosporangium subroseum]SNR91404.1 Endonuclease, Uma2 family (restriction endonuclease fold) [Streptosporangium subroseum]
MATTEPTTKRTVLQGEPPFTVDDLLTFPDDGNRYELFNGSLLVSPSPIPLHQRAIARLLRILEDAAPPELEPLPEVNLRVGPRDFFIPDLVVVSAETLDRTELMFAPDDILLAVEVVSPSTQMRDRHIKKVAYAAAGIPAYWRIELSEGPSLHVHELAGEEYKPAEKHEAGEIATLLVPFEASFDPAVLIRPRA